MEISKACDIELVGVAKTQFLLNDLFKNRIFEGVLTFHAMQVFGIFSTSGEVVNFLKKVLVYKSLMVCPKVEMEKSNKVL